MTSSLTSIDIKDVIIDANIGYIYGTNCFIGKMPEAPVNCITIYNTENNQQPHAINNIDYESIQLRCRNTHYKDGYDKLIALKTLLQSIDKFSKNDSDYIGIWSNSNIFFAGYNENNRAIWLTNFKVIREISDKGNRL